MALSEPVFVFLRRGKLVLGRLFYNAGCITRDDTLPTQTTDLCLQFLHLRLKIAQSAACADDQEKQEDGAANEQ